MARPKMKINVKKVTEKAKETTTGSIQWVNKPSDMRTFKFKKGPNRISIIPFVVSMANNPDGIDVGDAWYCTTVKVHMNIGAAGEAILCPSNFGKPCPICEHRRALMDEGAEWNDDSVSSLAPRKRQLFMIINEDDDDKSVQLMESSYKNFGELLETEIREDEEVAIFADPEDGMSLRCRGIEKTFGKNKYIGIDKITFEDRDPLSDEAVNSALDLHKILKVYSYDEIFSKLHVGNEEPETEEAPKPRGNKKVNKPEPEPEEDDSDSTEEEEQDSSDSTEESNQSENDSDCPHFGTNCGYDDEVCDECDNWRECRKATDKLLKAKRSR